MRRPGFAQTVVEVNRRPRQTDYTDQQFGLLELIIPPPELRWRKRTVDLREVVNWFVS